MNWILQRDRVPTLQDGPMANENKVQVEILTPSDNIERRNFFVARPDGCFDDFDLRPVKAWRPLPLNATAEPFRTRKRF